MLAPKFRDLSCPSLSPVELLARLRVHFPQAALTVQAKGRAYIGCQAQCWLAWDSQFIWSYDRAQGKWDKQRYHSHDERNAYWRQYWEQRPEAHWMGYAQSEEGYWAAYQYVFQQKEHGGYELLEQTERGLAQPSTQLEHYLYQTPRKRLPFEHWGEIETSPRLVEKKQSAMQPPQARNQQREQVYRGAAFSYFQQQAQSGRHLFFIDSSDRQWAGQTKELVLWGEGAKWERPLYFPKQPSMAKETGWTAAQRWRLDLALADLAKIGIKSDAIESAQQASTKDFFPLRFNPEEHIIDLIQAFAAPKQLGLAGWFRAGAGCFLPLLQLNRFLGKRHRRWEETVG